MDFEVAICYALVRFGIPLLLIFVVSIRQNLFSFIYLVHVFVSPLLPYSRSHPLTHGCTGIFQKVLVSCSALICVAQVVFQILLLVSPNEFGELDYCSGYGLIFNSIGLNRVDDLSFLNIFRLIVVDFIVFFSVATIFLITENVSAKLVQRQAKRRSNIQSLPNTRPRESVTAEGSSNVDPLSERLSDRSQNPPTESSSDANSDAKFISKLERKRQRRQKALETIKVVIEIVFFFILFGCGILNPSLLSAAYFITFLFIMTLVSCNITLGNFYRRLKIILCLVSFGHINALFLYQTQLLREQIPQETLEARLIGFTPYVKVNCTFAGEFHFETLNWNFYAHFYFLLSLYFVTAAFVRFKLRYQSEVPKHSRKEVYHISGLSVIPEDDEIQTRKPYMNLIKNSPDLVVNKSSTAFKNHINNSMIDLVDGKVQVIGYSMPLHHLSNSNHEQTPVCNISGTLLLSGNSRRYQTLQDSRDNSITRTLASEAERNDSLRLKDQSNERTSLSSSPRQPSIPMSPTSPIPKGNKLNRWAPIFYLMNLIKRGSYSATLIVMMTWSIAYHSWFGFVLLLWSCAIWMVPNSRQACLKSSLFLVIYAIFLLISQYIFSLQLNDNELPELKEIGFKKFKELSYKPLALKTLFTLMFWITLRQYYEEKDCEPTSNHRDSVFTLGITNPDRRSFQRHMSLASGAITNVNPTIIFLSNQIRNLFVKYWIWVVAIMLMVMSLGGDSVVIYRIVYMLLFLSFIFIFQCSFILWRRLMYPFWLCVIVYSMAVLIAIYTYQFKNFKIYWRDYFYTSEDMQAALGLVAYDNDPWILFKELFTPTFFLIITIIQLRFWHKDFLEFTKCELSNSSINSPHQAEQSTSFSTSASVTPTSAKNLDVRVDIEGPVVDSSLSHQKESDMPKNQPTPSAETSPSSEKTVETVKSVRENTALVYESTPLSKPKLKISLTELRAKIGKVKQRVDPVTKYIYVLFWRLMEVHAVKVVYFFVVAAAVKEISLINSVFVVLTVIGVPLPSLRRFVSLLIGAYASLVILCKLVYQLKLVHNSTQWISNCTLNETKVESFDNFEFIGLQVVSSDKVSSYISLDVLITLFMTLNSVVLVRQRIYYQRNSITPLPYGLIIPDVTRADAEKGFLGLIKYLLNYCFYKFGLEMTCFVIFVAIGNRSDFMSFFLTLHLVIFALCSRQIVRTVWPYFLGTMCTLMPIQYFMRVGLPPGLCYKYSWDLMDPSLKDWLFLPGLEPHVGKRLFYDFFVILFASCQSYIFWIEKNSNNQLYSGGSNCERGTDQDCDVVIEDFFTSRKNRYDHVRAKFFTSFCWLTLAIVFWAAMVPDNILGVGYIIGCFIFLWSGSEFYLKPYRTIITSWKLLIFYTIFVIFSKTLLEIIGCVAKKELGEYCWLVKLMSIVCRRKFSDSIGSCKLGKDAIYSTDIFWDGVCLCFLLVQKRIFGSRYFKYLVKEIWAQTTLASRGAELIHEVQLKEVREQEAAEREVMEKIKARMDHIRANQRALNEKHDKIKYHYQDDYAYDVSPYYSNGEGTYPHTPDAESPPPSTLPTVYSPTPSLPTMMSPSSAASHAEGKGYLEIFQIPYSPKFIDAQSSVPTVPSYSTRSSPFDDGLQPYPSIMGYASLPLGEQIPSETAIMSRPSFRVHQKPTQPLSRLPSIRRRVSLRSSIEASHGSSVKSGDYYLFEEPDAEIVDLNEPPARQYIPDPVGEELDKLAQVHGVTAFFSQYMQGQLTLEQIEAKKRMEEFTDIGESSKDSAIISVDREITQPGSSSAPTQMSTLPSTSLSRQDLSDSGSSTLSPGLGEVAKSDKESERPAPSKVGSETGLWLTLSKKAIWWSRVSVLFFRSCVISITSKLNSVSKDYRYVSRRLNIEKIALKKYFYEEDIARWEREADRKREILDRISRTKLSDLLKGGILPSSSSGKQLDQLELKADDRVPSEEKIINHEPFLDSNFFVRFLWSFFYAIVSHSEILCFFLVILNQLLNASLLSLPLALMVFMWGCLSVPRPTRIFWITIITYTELVVVLKYIFSFQSWPWHEWTDNNSPFWLPRLIGADKEGDENSYLDLLLLLALFFHRFMLKTLGLWDVEPTFDTLNEEGSQERVADKAQRSVESKEFLAKNETPTEKIDAKKKHTETQLRKRKPSPPEEDRTIVDRPAVENPASPNNTSADSLSDEIEMVQKIIVVGEELPHRIMKPFRIFFRRILHPPFRITRDYYALMFFCDFINFFTVWFGYSSFGTSPGGGDITTYLQENRVPMPFLAMLLFQFVLIIIDRALYLRKDIKKRFFFHIGIVIIIHIWLFFALPAITNRPFNSTNNLAPKFWYIFKSVYLLLSARQIKSGYPTRILGNCFTKKYGVVNSYLFTVYMMVPFLYDMRLMMDWMWTDTSLGLGEWAIMEDINKQLFIRKCELTFEENFPEPRSSARRRRPKYIKGGSYLLLMIGAIWFPLFIFALGGTIGQSSKPTDFSLELEFSGFQPIFKMSSTSNSLKTFDDKTFSRLEQLCHANDWQDGQNFLTSYGYQDTVKASINGNSTAIWGISPPSEKSLIDKLLKNETIIVKITWSITRPPSVTKNQKMDLSIYNSHSMTITSDVEGEKLRSQLVEMLNNTYQENEAGVGILPPEPARLKKIWPNYIEVPENGDPKVAEGFGEKFRDVNIVLRKGQFNNGSLTQWWEISEINCPKGSPFEYFNDDGEHCRYMTTVLFNDKVFPGPFLQLISGYGIFGLYTTFVLVVTRIIRGFFDDICTKVIYTQMPCVDRVLQLCLNIYLVRESREFGLEEDLYAKLIFLYRSPETLIKWTKPIEKIEAEEDKGRQIPS